MSHHLDTPEAAERGQLFIDDLFVFGVDASTVLVLAVNSTVTGSHADPDFWPGARYELKAHLDGSAHEQVTYRVTFGEPESAGQSLRLEVLTGDDASQDAAEGALVVEGQTGQVAEASGIRVWAGRAADPFFFDLSLLEPVSTSVREGSALDLSGWDPEKAENTFGGTTVASIVIEVPHGQHGLSAGATAGVWAATKLKDGDRWRQVNRGGHPMMWPVLWPDDTDFSDPANPRHPSEDVAAFSDELAGLVAVAVEASGSRPDPATYGGEVAAVLLPDVLSYEIGTAAQLDSGTRNGRPLDADAAQVMLSLFSGTTINAGLNADAAEDARSSDFPYVVPA